MEGTRINKYLSEIGHCSRREADKMIEQGRVIINGKVPQIGAKVGYRDKVKVDGSLVSSTREESVFLAFNKPVGIVTTTDVVDEKNNIIKYVNYPRRIFPIGRLDKDSEGLILLTSDGDVVNKILRSGNNHEKVYEVTVNKPITDDFIFKMGHGVAILGSITKKCRVEKLGPFVFSIVLTQGLNRQIRRMCEFLGYEVQRLKRVGIMHLTLDVPVGQWRDLTQEERIELYAAVADSSKTQKSASKGSATKKKKKPISLVPKPKTPQGRGKSHPKKNSSSRKPSRSSKPRNSGGKGRRR